MSIKRGDQVRHTISGAEGKVIGRGHYPDTIVISLQPAKLGEKARSTEIYLKHVELIQSPARI